MKSAEKRILRIKEVKEIAGVSRATIDRWVKKGSFPKSVKLGGPNTRSVGWRSADVYAWYESREQA